MTRPAPGIITSASNPLIKEVLHLREKRWRDRLAQFPVEGCREVTRALESGAELVLLLHCPALYTDPAAAPLVEAVRVRDVRVQEASENAFRRAAYRDRPDGILAVVRRREIPLASIATRSRALILVVESIEKPGNLGAILRSCDGVGADAVLVCDAVTDVCNPNVVRASLGTLFSRPVVQCSSEDAVRWLGERGIRIVAATPGGDVTYTSARLAGDVALVLGAEDRGLSQRWLEAADERVVIPMHGAADSLNVAMAATLLLYEALRQRAN